MCMVGNNEKSTPHHTMSKLMFPTHHVNKRFLGSSDVSHPDSLANNLS